ncbi:MAG: hypothetical protein OXQ94_13975 [Gemmatimonadota bacterium]|nr:hypothetical protein [Gemmatimonadota bacterium]
MATPDEAQANGIAWPWGDCCQESVEEEDFCCDNCCWFTNDCNGSADCNE